MEYSPKKPLITAVLGKLGFLSDPQREFISFAKTENILWANAIEQIPEDNGSVDVIYSSHMIEHIEKEDVVTFFEEAKRVLKSGGLIRIAVPDIKFHVENYLQSGDADKFIGATCLTRKKPGTIIAKIKYLIIGDRNHQWMYDGLSLCNFLSSVGFRDPKVMKPGTTGIEEPGMLDLKERLPESVFVEAVRP